MLVRRPSHTSAALSNMPTHARKSPPRAHLPPDVAPLHQAGVDGLPADARGGVVEDEHAGHVHLLLVVQNLQGLPGKKGRQTGKKESRNGK